MNAGSLFSGVGGLDLGLHRAGIQHAFFCESDPWRRAVLAHHWPGTPILTDVREAGPSLPHVELLCGGFPCQDLSMAGKRRGLDGNRSGLFFEFARIIDALRPRWVLLENVPGLLSSNGGRDFGTVLGTLADIGYGLAWRILDSRYFGVPQRRRRVFIVGTSVDGDPRAAAERAGQVLAVGTRCKGHPPTGTQAGEDVANPLGSSPRPGREQGGFRGDLDNDTYVSFDAEMSYHGTDGLADLNVATHRAVAYGLNTNRGGNADTVLTPEATPPITRSHGNPGGVMDASGVRRLTPVECERLQAWPDQWTNPDGKSPDSRRYAAAGDGVTATVGEWIGKRLMAA